MFTQIWMSTNCSFPLQFASYAFRAKWKDFISSPLVGVAWLSLKWFDLPQVLYHHHFIFCHTFVNVCFAIFSSHLRPCSISLQLTELQLLLWKLFLLPSVFCSAPWLWQHLYWACWKSPVPCRKRYLCLYHHAISQICPMWAYIWAISSDARDSICAILVNISCE